MPGFLPPSRPGRELGEPLLDAILEGRSLPPDAPEELCVVAEMLANLAGPAEPGELAGEAAARLGLARLASPAGVSPVAHRSARRKRSWISVPGGARLGAALIAAAVGLGGAAAAYAGALPGPIQNIAHHMFGAPPARDADLHRPLPGPDRSGPSTRRAPRPAKAASGKAKGHGKAKTHGKAKGHGKAKRHGRAKPAKSARGHAKNHGKAKGHAKAKLAKSPRGQANAHAKSAHAKHWARPRHKPVIITSAFLKSPR
jgi:hypothetical protein